MAETFEQRSAHTVYEKEKVGTVEIADEVFTVIAGLAATETEGVSSLAGDLTNAVIGRLGNKSLSKAVKVDVQDSSVSVDVALVLEAGASIPETSARVQEKIRSAIENMTGMTVENVNVRISGVNFG